jgi:preprotein translocase subunit SecE
VGGVATVARRSVAYVRDVRAEIRKVTWPTWLDLRRTTVVVSIFVIVIGIIIGILDRISSLLMIEWFPRLFS